MSHKLTVIQLLPALNNGGVERGTVEVANFHAEKGCTSIVISSGGNMVKKLSPDVEHIALDIGKKSFLTLLKIKTLKKSFSKNKPILSMLVPVYQLGWLTERLKASKTINRN